MRVRFPDRYYRELTEFTATKLKNVINLAALIKCALWNRFPLVPFSAITKVFSNLLLLVLPL